MTYTHPDYLTSTEDLAARIEAGDETLRIYDATVHLVPAEKGYKAISGEEDYGKGAGKKEEEEAVPVSS